MRTCVGVGGVGVYLCWSGWSRCVAVLEWVEQVHTCVGVGGVGAYLCWSGWSR